MINDNLAVRTLPQIANEIRYLDSQAKRLVLGHAIEIGNRLIEAKAMVPHGQWGDWLKAEFDYSQSSAQNFMRIADEYGETQMGLFGPEAKSQTLGNLPYTKALKLLAVPEDEREEFVGSHDVEAMSTRELEQAIRERDELKKQLEAEREAGEGSAMTIAELQSRADEAESKRAAAERQAQTLCETSDKLRAELRELESRPRDVAVQEPDPAEIDRRASELAQKLLSDADAKYKSDTEKLKAKIDAIEKKRDKLEQAVKDAEHRGVEDAAPYKAEAEQARAEVEKLKKQLAMSQNANVPIFNVHFKAVQEGFNKLFAILDNEEGETAGKLTAALQSLLQAELERLNGGPTDEGH